MLKSFDNYCEAAAELAGKPEKAKYHILGIILCTILKHIRFLYA